MLPGTKTCIKESGNRILRTYLMSISIQWFLQISFYEIYIKKIELVSGKQTLTLLISKIYLPRISLENIYQNNQKYLRLFANWLFYSMKLTKNQTDLTINAYIGLLFMPLPQHTVCKSLMKLYRFNHVVIYEKYPKNAIESENLP